MMAVWGQRLGRLGRADSPDPLPHGDEPITRLLASKSPAAGLLAAGPSPLLGQDVPAPGGFECLDQRNSTPQIYAIELD